MILGGEYTYPDNEEDTCKHRSWHGMQHNKEWPSHGTDDCQAHQEMRYTLFHHLSRFDDSSADLGAFSFFSRDDTEFGLVDSERVGVYRGLIQLVSLCINLELRTIDIPVGPSHWALGYP